MTIKCQSIKELTIVCAELVRQGVTFEAETKTLTVTLLGGY